MESFAPSKGPDAFTIFISYWGSKPCIKYRYIPYPPIEIGHERDTGPVEYIYKS